MLLEIFNEDWLQSLDTFEEIMWFLVIYLIILVVMAIFLKLALSFFSKAKHTEFGSVFLTSFIITLFIAIIFLFLGSWLAWIVALILIWIIISARHNVGFLYAIVVTVIAFLLYILVIWIIGALLHVTIVVWPW